MVIYYDGDIPIDGSIETVYATGVVYGSGDYIDDSYEDITPSLTTTTSVTATTTVIVKITSSTPSVTEYESGDGGDKDEIIPSSLTTTTTAATATTTTIVKVDSSDSSSICLWPSIPVIILCVVGLLGFVSLLVLIKRRHQHIRITYKSWFLTHTCIAYAIALLSSPFIVVEEYLCDTNSEAVAVARRVRKTIFYLYFFSSIFFLLFISVGQFVTFNKLMKRKVNTPYFLIVSSALIWILSVILCIPLNYNEDSEIANTIYLSLFFFIFFGCMMTTGLFIIFKWRYVLNQKYILRNQNELSKMKTVTSTSNQLKSGHPLKTTDIFITVIFYLSWIPFMAISLHNSEKKNILKISENKTIAEDIALFVAYANTAFIPYQLLYSMKKRFQSYQLSQA